MPRRTRQETPGGIFHVTARGNAATAIFLDDNDRLSFLNLVDRAQQRLGWILHAYCLLDTHVHLLVETPEPNLGRGMQGVLGGYAAFFNRRHQRFGHLFGERYHAVEVGSETYLVQAVVYVLLNPLRAGIVRHPRAWPWSSTDASSIMGRRWPTRLRPRARLHRPRRRRRTSPTRTSRRRSGAGTPGSG